MSLKLVSLNIEGDNHYDTLFPFLEYQRPDVICLQEVFAVDMPLLEQKTGMPGVHVPLLNVLHENKVRLAPKGIWGMAIFSKYPIKNLKTGYIAKKDGELPVYQGGANEMNRSVVSASIQKDGVPYAIATTHFTWTPAGTVTDLQRSDLKTLFGILDSLGECVLCGDFNAPRGKEVFDALAERLRDNIPKEATTTIDQKLHRQPGIQFVVDGLFTSPQYTALDVRVVDGVSDHCGIVGVIERKE